MKTAMIGLTALGTMAFTASFAGAAAQAIDLDDSPFALGTLSAEEGALGQDVWQGADPDALATLLDALPRAYAEPAYLDIARRLLLSPASAPEGADDALAGAKLLAAAELGYYREAGQLAELAPQLSGQPALTKVAALSALLDGDVRRACARGARLTQGRADPFFLRLRYLCYVDAGEAAAADLTLGLLRDQGLGEGTDRVFTALQTAGDLGGTVSPADAFEYAGAQMAGAAVGTGAVAELSGSVLAAVARDADAATGLRLPALERALSLGLIGASEGQRLAAEMAETALAADVVAVATERPGSPGSAEAIARSLRAAPTYDAFRARAILHADALRASDPVIGYAPDADVLALASIIAGDERAAGAWLAAMRSEAGADPGAYEALTGLLRLANGTERAVSVPLSDPMAATGTGIADLVDSALSAARGGAPGAAALVALTGLGVDADGEAEAIRESVVLAMLDQSGLAGEVAKRAALDIQAASVFAQLSGGGEPVPRMKPGNP